MLSAQERNMRWITNYIDIRKSENELIKYKFHLVLSVSMQNVPRENEWIPDKCAGIRKMSYNWIKNVYFGRRIGLFFSLASLSLILRKEEITTKQKKNKSDSSIDGMEIDMFLLVFVIEIQWFR